MKFKNRNETTNPTSSTVMDDNSSLNLNLTEIPFKKKKSKFGPAFDRFVSDYR